MSGIGIERQVLEGGGGLSVDMVYGGGGGRGGGCCVVDWGK